MEEFAVEKMASYFQTKRKLMICGFQEKVDCLGEWRGGTSPLRSSSCAPHGAQPSQKPACRFPARASSAVDSQYGEGLHPCKRDVQPRTPQRKRFLNLLKFLPNYAAPLAATGKHLTPVALCKAVDPME